VSALLDGPVDLLSLGLALRSTVVDRQSFITGSEVCRRSRSGRDAGSPFGVEPVDQLCQWLATDGLGPWMLHLVSSASGRAGGNFVCDRRQRGIGW